MSATALADLRAGRIPDATRLSLAGLDLERLPSELFDLGDTLRVLDVGANALRDLPDDFARLTKLEVLFASGNPMPRLPPVLGTLPNLGQVGLRGCRMREVPGDALPPRLRWLTLTDNAIDMLPRALGERPCLQKLMLAGNRLSSLPDHLAAAPNLELIRLAANRFEALPSWLADLPRLAWLACAGNPLDRRGPAEATSSAAREVAWRDLAVEAPLGRGASGQVHRARWRDGAEERQVAVKLFHGEMTSDGLPECEMAACLAAGESQHLAGGLGRVTGHPEGKAGLVMPLLPAHWRALAGPPSPASCSRDVYPPGFALAGSAALRIATAVTRAGAHLHGRSILHGDLYAHNVLWDGEFGAAVLSDFGAASMLTAANTALLGLDVLATGLLLGEIAARCDDAAVVAGLRPIATACSASAARERPRLADVADALAALAARSGS